MVFSGGRGGFVATPAEGVDLRAVVWEPLGVLRRQLDIQLRPEGGAVLRELAWLLHAGRRMAITRSRRMSRERECLNGCLSGLRLSSASRHG